MSTGGGSDLWLRALGLEHAGRLTRGRAVPDRDVDGDLALGIGSAQPAARGLCHDTRAVDAAARRGIAVCARDAGNTRQATIRALQVPVVASTDPGCPSLNKGGHGCASWEGEGGSQQSMPTWGTQALAAACTVKGAIDASCRSSDNSKLKGMVGSRLRAEGRVRFD